VDVAVSCTDACEGHCIPLTQRAAQEAPSDKDAQGCRRSRVHRGIVVEEELSLEEEAEDDA
jgi:hypothetical protein